jgi:alanyl-tRNA synthetase
MLPSLAASAQVLEMPSSKVGVQVADVPPQLVAKLAGMIAESTEGVGISVSGTRIAISSKTLDAGALLKMIQNAAGGKGGGSPKAANGSLDRAVTADELTTILKGPSV